MTESRALILGLGNLSRSDDGFGWYVVNAVRSRQGLQPINDTDDGMDALGGKVDTVFLPQLSSDLADLVAEYDNFIVVDARIGGEPRLYLETVAQDEGDRTRLLTHDLRPADLLALARALYGKAPRAFTVSVPGGCFDFGTGLSEAMEVFVGPAADACLYLAAGVVPPADRDSGRVDGPAAAVDSVPRAL